jgi:hypothetical protein
MPPKHPFIDEADKAAFLSRIDDGNAIVPAAKRSKIYLKSTRRIITKSHEIEIYNNNHNLSPLSLHGRVANKPMTRRDPVMLEIDINRLQGAIEKDRHYREMRQFKVAQKLGIKASQSTIRKEIKARYLNRVKPTKKLALTPIQEAQRYEIALSRKDCVRACSQYSELIELQRLSMYKKVQLPVEDWIPPVSIY